MLVMKIRSSSPVNSLYIGFYVHVQKKKKKVAIYRWLSPATGESRLSNRIRIVYWSMVIVKKKKKISCVHQLLCLLSLYSINVLNDYMRFFTGLYCESLI